MNPEGPADIRSMGVTAWSRRLHAWLMPDYNRAAATYWWLAVIAGSLLVFSALGWLVQQPGPVVALVLVGMAVAMAAGVFPVRVPHSTHSFAVGETFIFLLLLMHGPYAALLAAAGEGAVGSWRTSKRWTSRLASPAMAAMAMWAAGSVFVMLYGYLKAQGLDHPGLLVVLAMVLALGYFMLNTLLVTGITHLKRGRGWTVQDLFTVFGWVGIAYAGSATLAVLLFLTYQQSGLGVLLATVPLLGMLLATLHYFFRQQEAAESVRRAGRAATEREAELAARHVRELEASERRFHSAFTHASIGMALMAFDGRILQANPALRTLLGRPGDELVKLRFQDQVVEEDRAAMSEQLGLIEGHDFEGFALELRCQHSKGSAVWVAAHCSYFSEPGASEPCLILQLQDITARRCAQAELNQIAFQDALTALPNRRRFQELLTQAVKLANEQPGEAYAVMFLDFDRFKLINDSLGHTAGDQFLVQVSHRIRDCLRPSDVVARLGGDEFAVLVRQLEHESRAIELAERLMEALRKPFRVAGTELMTSASVGITFSALGYSSPEDVLRDADTAMYKAKGAGKARYALFDASLHTEVANRLRLEGELRRAIDEGQLSVVYQPVFEISAEGNRIAGFEALVRWLHPQDGAIAPAAFLPIAEEAGLMVRLTDFVMHCASRQLREWLALGPAWAGLRMNVNLSGHDLAHPALLARVTRAIVEAGLRPQQLCLELTENILMSRLEAALPVLSELQKLGVGLAIDDFGTGYSSLSHLSTLPIDCLKIDRSFVAALAPGKAEEAVVRSVILLGQSLGKSVVAEGIETAAQQEMLLQLGCPLGQGFHLARPMPAAQVTALLQATAPANLDLWCRQSPWAATAQPKPDNARISGATAAACVAVLH